MTMPDYLISGEQARLIPVAADSSKEVRAASILLATLMSVPPFARSMLASLGQRVGARANIDCYTEVVFKDGADAAKARPDGLLVLDGGRGRLWCGVVLSRRKSVARNWITIKSADTSLSLRATRLVPC
jgi:hypothetical protein